MAKKPKDVQRFNVLWALDLPTLQRMAKKELNKARVRLQRLIAATGGREEKWSYSARYAKNEVIKPFLNSSGNVSLSTKGLNKAQLINAIMRGESFNAMATTVAKNKANIKVEVDIEKRKGGDENTLERRKRMWDIASRIGAFDVFDPSNEEENTDIFRIILDAESKNLTDDEFESFLTNLMNASPFDMWGEDDKAKWSLRTKKRQAIRHTKDNKLIHNDDDSYSVKDNPSIWDAIVELADDVFGKG